MPDEVDLIPRKFPRARFLSEQEQEKYGEACKQFGEKAKRFLDIPIHGTNVWKVLLLNQIGIRTATLPELYCALDNAMDLKGYCECAPSVILPREKRDNNTSIDYLANGLVKKLKLTLETPTIINGLRIVSDKHSVYGLNFDTRNAEIISAPDFDGMKNNWKYFSRLNEDYSIEFDEKGPRRLYTSASRLAGLYLGNELNLHYSDGFLPDTNGSRTVVIIGPTASQKH